MLKVAYASNAYTDRQTDRQTDRHTHTHTHTHAEIHIERRARANTHNTHTHIDPLYVCLSVCLSLSLTNKSPFQYTQDKHVGKQTETQRRTG